MSHRSIRLACLALALIVLLTMSGVAGCGKGKEAGVKEIRLGLLTDFTGAAAYAVKHHGDSFMDYFRWAEEKDPIPGVSIKVLTYDTRSDYGRVVPGYMWLKGQGTILMHPVSGDDMAMLEDRFTSDGIVTVNSYLSERFLHDDWTYCLGLSQEEEGEVFMQWIMNTWDYAGKGRPPRIGHQGWNRESSLLYQAGMDRILTAYPDKFQWVATERSPVGTSAWAIEISRMKSCDYVFMTMVGAMLSSFMKEARSRGYDGSFASGSIALPGFWGLIMGNVPADNLHDSYFLHCVPFWSDDIPYINSCKEAILRYHASDAEERMLATGPLAAWGTAMYVYQAIRGAVEKVGAANVDGVALRDALEELDMPIEGFDYSWHFYHDYHLLLRDARVFEWDSAEGKFEPVTQRIAPRSLAGLT